MSFSSSPALSLDSIIGYLEVRLYEVQRQREEDVRQREILLDRIQELEQRVSMLEQNRGNSRPADTTDRVQGDNIERYRDIEEVAARARERIRSTASPFIPSPAHATSYTSSIPPPSSSSTRPLVSNTVQESPSPLFQYRLPNEQMMRERERNRERQRQRERERERRETSKQTESGTDKISYAYAETEPVRLQRSPLVREKAGRQLMQVQQTTGIANQQSRYDTVPEERVQSDGTWLEIVLTTDYTRAPSQNNTSLSDIIFAKVTGLGSFTCTITPIPTQQAVFVFTTPKDPSLHNDGGSVWHSPSMKGSENGTAIAVPFCVFPIMPVQDDVSFQLSDIVYSCEHIPLDVSDDGGVVFNVSSSEV